MTKPYTTLRDLNARKLDVEKLLSFFGPDYPSRKPIYFIDVLDKLGLYYTLGAFESAPGYASTCVEFALKCEAQARCCLSADDIRNDSWAFYWACKSHEAAREAPVDIGKAYSWGIKASQYAIKARSLAAYYERINAYKLPDSEQVSLVSNAKLTAEKEQVGFLRELLTSEGI